MILMIEYQVLYCTHKRYTYHLDRDQSAAGLPLFLLSHPLPSHFSQVRVVHPQLQLCARVKARGFAVAIPKRQWEALVMWGMCKSRKLPRDRCAIIPNGASTDLQSVQGTSYTTWGYKDGLVGLRVDGDVVSSGLSVAALPSAVAIYPKIFNFFFSPLHLIQCPVSCELTTAASPELICIQAYTHIHETKQHNGYHQARIRPCK